MNNGWPPALAGEPATRGKVDRKPKFDRQGTLQSHSLGRMRTRMQSHPSYPNPQLVEALCEIRFKVAEAAASQPSKAGALFKAFQDDYPEIEPQPVIHLVVGPHGTPEQQPTPPVRFKLKHRDRPMILVVSEHAFALSALRPYPGWAHLKAELERVWPVVLNVFGPEPATRIGMRYINRIQRRSADEKPAFWLQQSDIMPTAILDSGPNFSLRLDARKNHKNRVIISLAHDTSDPKETFGAMIFDIDRIIGARSTHRGMP